MEIGMKIGFTLLELLISIGVISLVTIVLTQILFSTMHVNTKTEIMKEVKQNGDFALGVMVRMIHNAQVIGSVCDGTPASSISMTNLDGGTTDFTCMSDSSVFRIASNSAFLTSSKVTLTGSGCSDALTFTCVTEANNSKNIQISFSLAQVGTPPAAYETASTTFQTNVSVRSQ